MQTKERITSRRRILAAEDDPLLGPLVRMALESAGHDVTWAPDGAAALAELAQAEFDLVITDHQMPNLNGLRLVERLRARQFPGQIALHCTSPRPAEWAAYQALRIDGFLSKPALPHVLIEFVAGLSARERHQNSAA